MSSQLRRICINCVSMVKSMIPASLICAVNSRCLTRQHTCEFGIDLTGFEAFHAKCVRRYPGQDQLPGSFEHRQDTERDDIDYHAGGRQAVYTGEVHESRLVPAGYRPGLSLRCGSQCPGRTANPHAGEQQNPQNQPRPLPRRRFLIASHWTFRGCSTSTWIWKF